MYSLFKLRNIVAEAFNKPDEKVSISDVDVVYIKKRGNIKIETSWRLLNSLNEGIETLSECIYRRSLASIRVFKKEENNWNVIYNPHTVLGVIPPHKDLLINNEEVELAFKNEYGHEYIILTHENERILYYEVHILHIHMIKHRIDYYVIGILAGLLYHKDASSSSLSAPYAIYDDLKLYVNTNIARTVMKFLANTIDIE